MAWFVGFPSSDAFISSLDALLEAVKVDLRHGSTVRAHKFLEWLFAVAIGRTDDIPTGPETQDAVKQSDTEADQPTAEPKAHEEAIETPTEPKAQGEVEEGATEPKLQDLFKEALALVTEIADKRDTDMKRSLKDL